MGYRAEELELEAGEERQTALGIAESDSCDGETITTGGGFHFNSNSASVCLFPLQIAPASGTDNSSSRCLYSNVKSDLIL